MRPSGPVVTGAMSGDNVKKTTAPGAGRRKTAKAKGGKPGKSPRIPGEAKLTAKQEAFCIEIVKGSNLSDAYKAVYSAANMKQATVHRCATELFANPLITARIAELRAPVIKNARITLEDHIAEMASLKAEAKKAGQFSAAIKAEELRGKVSGLYVEKHEHSGPGGGAIPVDMVWKVVIVKANHADV